MAANVQLVLVIHNHQPVGNFDSVINDACDRAYLPFLRLLAEHPGVRLGLHTSGCLWEWLEAHRPEYGLLVSELLERGQIELLGGGMYEPILPVLPRRDAVWQLQRHTQFLNERFGVTPQGMWCPERVWEPHLPEVITAANLEYTLLDDFHFRSSVLAAQVATDYFVTEHAGSTVKLLPISKKLRYTIPFKPVSDTLDYLHELARQAPHTPLAVFGDDGEKFGVWPETYEWVYEKHWLSDFLATLEGNLDWIELGLPSEILDQRRPVAKVFVPCTSYPEMGEWSRVDPDADDDDPPGFWRNYLHKYPEANAMYRRMLGVSNLLAEARALGAPAEDLAAAADDLGRGQCNCAYWHGIFGGLYLNYLRQAVSHHLISAEQRLLDSCPELRDQNMVPTDHDGLGWKQYVMRTKDVTAIVDPGRGLCLTRLDYRPTLFCWTDVLARRREAYHSKVAAADSRDKHEGKHDSIHKRVVAKEEGLLAKLVVDQHQRVSLTTYFSNIKSVQQVLTVPDPSSAAPGIRFADYYSTLSETRTESGALSGTINHGSFRLRKALRLHDASVSLAVMHQGGELPEGLGDYFVELNLTVLTDKARDRYLTVDGERHEVAEATQWSNPAELRLVDGWQGRAMHISSRQLKRILHYPVYAVSSSEGGFERTYQGSCLLLGFDPRTLTGGIALDLRIVEI